MCSCFALFVHLGQHCCVTQSELTAQLIRSYSGTADAAAHLELHEVIIGLPGYKTFVIGMLSQV
jgi:hypothetical protein